MRFSVIRGKIEGVGMSMPRPLVIIFALVSLLAVGNIAALDVWLWKMNQVAPSAGVIPNRDFTSTQPSTSFLEGPPASASGTTCEACLAQVQEATAALTLRVTQLEQALAKKTVVSTTITPPPSASSTAKEYFIPLGGGSSNADDWTDVPGLQAYVDTALYGRIKTVTFEASLRTPTGNQSANARLYNVTDGHPVWNSDVSIEGGTPQLLISSPITLGTGSKLYKVQMKTQLKFITYLDQSRIHIMTY